MLWNLHICLWHYALSVGCTFGLGSPLTDIHQVLQESLIKTPEEFSAQHVKTFRNHHLDNVRRAYLTNSKNNGRHHRIIQCDQFRPQIGISLNYTGHGFQTGATLTFHFCSMYGRVRVGLTITRAFTLYTYSGTVFPGGKDHLDN